MSKTFNAINDRLVRNIIYDVVNRVNFSTGPTGISPINSIINPNGNLISNIFPQNTNALDIGQSDLELSSVYTNRFYLNNSEISADSGGINFPPGSTLIGDEEGSITVKGKLLNSSQ